MLGLGVNIAIITEGKILLTQREDFEVWCLPGGAVDEGESVAAAAIREAREETGLKIELTRLIGLYSRPSWPGAGMHIVSFAARSVGGEINSDPHEVIDIGYFAPDALPNDLLWWHCQRISDAFNGVSGAAWTQDVAYPFEQHIDRAAIYKMRDESGLARRDFYYQTIGATTNAREIRELAAEKS
jgi:ADP-ribose pyrophosphatase YjhB (NUDIX family)